MLITFFNSRDVIIAPDLGAADCLLRDQRLKRLMFTEMVQPGLFVVVQRRDLLLLNWRLLSKVNLVVGHPCAQHSALDRD